MTYCPNCGASVEGRFCVKCGTPVTASAGGPANASGAAAQPQYAAPAAGGLTDNVAGALCYVLGLITGIVFLVLAPYNQSKFVRFHAFQAIFFHVAFIALIIIDTAISFALPWSLSAITSLLWMIIMLGAFAAWVLLLLKAYQGQKFKLPLIGDLAEKQA